VNLADKAAGGARETFLWLRNRSVNLCLRPKTRQLSPRTSTERVGKRLSEHKYMCELCCESQPVSKPFGLGRVIGIQFDIVGRKVAGPVLRGSGSNADGKFDRRGRRLTYAAANYGGFKGNRLTPFE
jgi:hypothetical protein